MTEETMSGIGFEQASLSDFLRDAGAFLRRRVRGIVVGAFLGAGLGVFAITQLDTRYESELLLRVEQPARSPIEAEQVPGGPSDAFLDGQVYIIESTEILRDAIDRAGLMDDAYFQRQPKGWLRQTLDRLTAAILPSSPEPDDAVGPAMDELTPAEIYAVRTLRAGLDIYRRGDSELISVKVTTDSARLAARAANAVGAAFQAHREAAQLTQASRVAGWLDERAFELQRRLAEAEDAVAAFKIENGLISGEPGTTLNEQQLTQLNSQLIETRAELAERSAAYARFLDVFSTGGDVHSLPEVQASEIVSTLRGRLLELERREAELGGDQATNPRVASIREERRAIEAQLATEVDRIREGIANELETLVARETLVVEALSRAGGETGLESRSSVELRELERRAAAYRALYERYLSNSGLVDEGITYLSSGIEIIDRANVPEHPVFPPKKVFVLFGLLFGAALGALIGIVRDALLPGFMTARQVSRAVGLPVLSFVPELGARQDPQRLTLEDPMSPYAEAIRTLRHEMSSTHIGEAGHAPVHLLTSSSAGEGKTTLAAAMATSAAAGGQNVLLIDADLRRGVLSRLFIPEEDTSGVGLTDMLRTGTWSLPDLEPGAGDIDLLPSGKAVASPTDLLSSPHFRAYLDQARRLYDLVVIDGPPVANMADAAILSRLADAIAFVVRWNDTPREVVTEAVRRLGNPIAPVGVALNAVDLQQAAEYGETYGQYVLTTVKANPVRRRVLV